MSPIVRCRVSTTYRHWGDELREMLARSLRNMPFLREWENPVSEWQEAVEIEGLTLYDIHRAPRKPLPDHETRELPDTVVNSELLCPICLGVLTNTMIVMECLHRFCGECIQKCIRLGKRECPSCRKHVPSRRSLRADTNFDALIARLHPDCVPACNAGVQIAPPEQSQFDIADHKRRYNEQVMKIQADARKRKEYMDKQNATTASQSTASSGLKRAKLDHIDKAQFTLQPFTGDDGLEYEVLQALKRPHIRAPCIATIWNMKNYIISQLEQLPQRKFAIELYVRFRGRYILLDDALELKTIVFQLWDRQSLLILFYRAVPLVSRERWAAPSKIFSTESNAT